MVKDPLPLLTFVKHRTKCSRRMSCCRLEGGRDVYFYDTVVVRSAADES